VVMPIALFPLVRSHLFDCLAERPDVALEVDGTIRAIAVELCGRFHRNLRAGLSRTFAVRVDVRGKLDVHRLSVEAIDRGGAFMHRTPLGAD
jgi:hypothetical protein